MNLAQVMHDVVAEDMPMPAVFRDTIMIKPANMSRRAAAGWHAQSCWLKGRKEEGNGLGKN